MTKRKGMTDLHTAAMRLALEALIAATPVKAKDPQMQADAIVALREALALVNEVDQEQPAPRIIDCHANGVCVQSGLRAEQPAPVQQEPVAWVPYLSDRADGVKGHYAIARWNPRGYREVWNLRSHQWSAYSDDVLSLEEADALLRLITIPTRKVTSPPAQRKPWVGLTDEETGHWAADFLDGAKWAEAKLKEKNA